jgi:hypothetical protein
MESSDADAGMPFRIAWDRFGVLRKPTGPLLVILNLLSLGVLALSAGNSQRLTPLDGLRLQYAG